MFSTVGLHSMIGYWHHTVVCLSVCLSVRPSVTLCIAAVRVCVVFLRRHFLFSSSETSYRMYRLATIAVICIVQPEDTAKNRTDEISGYGIALGTELE